MSDAVLTSPTTPADYAEMAVLWVGMLVLAWAVIDLTVRKGWASALSLPPSPEHVIEPVDLLAAFLALFCLAPLAVAAGWPETTTRPTSEPADLTTIPTIGQLIVHLGFRVAGIAILVHIGRRRFIGGLRGWGLSRARMGRTALTAALVYLAFWPVCTAVVYLTHLIILRIRPDYVFVPHASIEILHARKTGWPVAVMTVIDAILIAPVIEELLFRGLLQPALTQWWRSPGGAIVLCGLAFGMIHFANVETVPALALFGVVLGVVYAKTRSLTAPIALHMIFNAKTLAFVALDAATGGR